MSYSNPFQYVTIEEIRRWDINKHYNEKRSSKSVFEIIENIPNQAFEVGLWTSKFCRANSNRCTHHHNYSYKCDFISDHSFACTSKS